MTHLQELTLPGVKLLTHRVFPDARGFFTELHHAPRYRDLGIDVDFVQDNHSRSRRGVIRGLHYQRRHPQGKLLSVVRGAILDVVADVRPGSPTFGQWCAVRLDEASGQQLWVPPGYAHGFAVLSEVADVLYKCTDIYRPEDGRGVRWDDPLLDIEWGVEPPILSAADAALPWLDAVGADELPRWEAPCDR